MTYTHVWRVRRHRSGEPALPDRFGQPCRVVVTGRKNSVLVEFADGYRVVTSRYFVRRATDA